MSGKSVLVVGPGFIGWHVLDLLIAEDYHVTGLVRRQAHADGIKASGATPIFGDLDDRALITSETAKVDIVLHTATADHLPSAEAILDGVRQRAAAGKSTIYIHTSGTSVLDDSAKGAYLGDRTYPDDDPTAIDALADNAPHRPIDLTIVRAAKDLGDKAKIAIMIPPEIYGYNPAHQRLSIQIPVLTRFALKHGYAGHVGKGLSVESQIHVADLARAYMVLLYAMEARAPEWVLANPYFFCENGKVFSWLEVAEHIGSALAAKGRIADATPKTIPESEYGDLFGDITDGIVGLNSRSRAVRLRELGWTPREKGIWESYEQDELPVILAEWDEKQ